jgi:hypothetical protein
VQAELVIRRDDGSSTVAAMILATTTIAVARRGQLKGSREWLRQK